MSHVVLPTLAVALSWLCVGVMLGGCGYVVRRLLVRGAVPTLTVADLWLGFALLLVYLQLWSIFLSVSARAWVAPAVLGAAGALTGARGSRRPVHPRLLSGVVAATAAGTLWLANRALAAATDYDLGLYHLSAIGYTLRSATIPGLGNLHARLGAGEGHLLLVALLSHGPWAGAGFHLANGLLVSMLLVDIASRFVTAPVLRRPPSFTRRMALLLVPSTVAAVGIGSEYRLSSPNLDLSTYVLAVAGALYLADYVEHGFRRVSALTATAAFAAAAVTRPLYWLPTVLAVGIFAVGETKRRETTWRQLARSAGQVITLPAALLLGAAGRQAILSGYPFFPLTVVALPVDWRMPAAAVDRLNQVIETWARWPGRAPGTIGPLSHWLAHWVRMQARDFDVMAPLSLLAALIPSLTTRLDADLEGRSERRAPLCAVLIVAVPTLAAWFLAAPDPRFALAPIWLVPISLVAWALPALALPRPGIGLIGVAFVSLVFVSFVSDIRWLALSAFDLWAFATIAMWRLSPKRSRALLAFGAVLTVVAVPIRIIAARGAFDVVVSNQSGPLGTPPLPTPAVSPFHASGGLEIFTPAGQGADQCWRVVLCTPQPSPDLRLRGAGLDSGFTLRR